MTTPIQQFNKGFGQGVKLFGENIGTIVNSMLLLIVYIIGIGITSVLAKLFGKKFLETKISGDNKTYWSDVDLKRKQTENYYQQF